MNLGAYAKIINQMAEHLEGNEPAPNHCDEANLVAFYMDLIAGLTPKAREMVRKLANGSYS